jgi:AcrR family transcriptional regulator
MSNSPENNPSYERILAAGEALFIEQGFPETSMEAIAQRANVVRATVYNNFKDKEAILAELMTRYWEDYVEIPRRLRERARPEQTSFELIEEMIRSAIVWRVRNAELRPLVDLCRHLPGSPCPKLNADADAAMHDWILEIHGREAGRGLLREDVDLDFATRALYLMIEAVLASFDPRASTGHLDAAVHQLALVNWHALYREGPYA